MSHVMEMIETYPKDLGTLDRTRLRQCIEACLDCAQTCTACADACLSEDMVADLVKCIRLNLDCADICEITGRVLSRHTGHDPALTQSALTACMEACRMCAEECERHSMHAHCRVCAEACRRCEQACRDMLASAD